MQQLSGKLHYTIGFPFIGVAFRRQAIAGKSA
jgi:hypothetical protein